MAIKTALSALTHADKDIERVQRENDRLKVTIQATRERLTDNAYLSEALQAKEKDAGLKVITSLELQLADNLDEIKRLTHEKLQAIQAIKLLSAYNRRIADIFKLRYIAGLSSEKVAEMSHISSRHLRRLHQEGMTYLKENYQQGDKA